MKIYKYLLNLEAEINVIELPQDAIIISCGLDSHNKACFWAMVNPNAEKELRNIYLIKTGQDADNFFNLSKSTEFIGTIKDNNSVLHIFAEEVSRVLRVNKNV